MHDPTAATILPANNSVRWDENVQYGWFQRIHQPLLVKILCRNRPKHDDYEDDAYVSNHSSLTTIAQCGRYSLPFDHLDRPPFIYRLEVDHNCRRLGDRLAEPRAF